MKGVIRVLAVAAAVVFPALPAMAQNVTPIGTYQDWAAYSFTESGGKVCYMASTPNKAEGDYTRRGDVFAMVTHRPGDGTSDVVSFIAGYTYEQGSEVEVRIDGRSPVKLFTHEGTSWARSAETDRELVQAMRRGLTMVVRGTSSRGTLTTDTYSLRGFTAAHNAINQACNVN